MNTELKMHRALLIFISTHTLDILDYPFNSVLRFFTGKRKMIITVLLNWQDCCDKAME